MNYQSKILFIFPLLLGLIFFGAMGFAHAQNATATAQSNSAAHAGKTSSSNIHIDDIAIKISPDAQSGSSPISDEDHKRLVSKLSDDAEKEVSSWVTRQMLFGLIAIFVALVVVILKVIVWAIEKSVEKLVEKEMTRSNKLIDSAVSRLIDKQADTMVATNKTIEATTNANDEIERTKKALDELQDIEKELNNKLKDFRCEIDKEVKNTALIKIDLDLAKLESEERTTGETYELENKIKALKLIINEIDKDDAAKNQVVSKLIRESLKSGDKETKYNAVELLSQFELESDEITNAFVEALKDTEDKTLGSLLISELGKLKCDDQTLEYLLELLDNLNNSYTLFIIGSLGELGEIGKDKITDTALESIINKLLLILNNNLDNKEFASDITASQVRSAIAVALSWYGKKAANAENDVINMLEDKEPETRKNAAIALEKIGSKNAITALNKLINDESIIVSDAAKKAIEELEKL